MTKVTIETSIFKITYDKTDDINVKCHVSEDYIEDGQVVVTLVVDWKNKNEQEQRKE